MNRVIKKRTGFSWWRSLLSSAFISIILHSVNIYWKNLGWRSEIRTSACCIRRSPPPNSPFSSLLAVEFYCHVLAGPPLRLISSKENYFLEAIKFSITFFLFRWTLLGVLDWSLILQLCWSSFEYSAAGCLIRIRERTITWHHWVYWAYIGLCRFFSTKIVMSI